MRVLLLNLEILQLLLIQFLKNTMVHLWIWYKKYIKSPLNLKRTSKDEFIFANP